MSRHGLAETLRRAAEAMTGETVSIGELLDEIGDHGLLMLCIILMVPFLFPVSIPGVSTLFSTVVIITGAAIMTGRSNPWLPERLVRRRVRTSKLVPVLDRGSRILARLDRMTRPRLHGLTGTSLMSRVNGAAILLGGIFLLFPLGGVPLSNTLPALAVLLVAAGITQRDGVFVLGGYFMLVLTAAYFAFLAYLVFIAGKSLADIL